MDEVKSNKATRQRHIDRVIDGPAIAIDIEYYIKELKKEDAWEKGDRNGITIYKSEHVAMVLSVLRKGVDFVDNTVDGYLTIQVLEGKVRIITLSKETVELKEGQIACFHPGVYNSIEALSDATILLTNHIPV
jgi:quercetin dioxygenase-like cupin family protein